MHTIFDVKVDGRYKNPVVEDGHLAATPLESFYSGVVLLRVFERIYLSMN